MLFTEWFHQCFIPEVKEYLGKGGLPLKVLLITDSASGHSQNISIEDENVEAVFLPPNSTSLHQPLDQGIIWCVTASNTRNIFEIIRGAIDADPNLQVMDCWKSFTIADAINLIEAAMDELKPETVNACWKNLCSEVVHDFKGFPGIDGEVKKIIRITRESGGEGFVEMIDKEVEEHIEELQEFLANKELEDLVKSSTGEEEEIEVRRTNNVDTGKIWRSVSDGTKRKGKNNGL